MYACMTKDEREKFYVYVEGYNEDDCGFISVLCKSKENAIKQVKYLVNQRNKKFPFLKLKVTELVLDVIEMAKYKKEITK